MFEVVGANLRGVTLRQKGETDAASDLFVPWERISVDSGDWFDLFDESGQPLRVNGRVLRLSRIDSLVDISGAERMQQQCIERLIRQGTLHVVIDRRERLRQDMIFTVALAAIFVAIFTGVLWMAVMSLSHFTDAFDLLYVVYFLVMLTLTGTFALRGLRCVADVVSRKTPVRLEVHGTRMRIVERCGHVCGIDAADTPSHRDCVIRLRRLPWRKDSRADEALDSRERAIWKAFEQGVEPQHTPKPREPSPWWTDLLRCQAGMLLCSFLFWMQVIEYALGREPDVQQCITGAVAAGGLHCWIFLIVFMVVSESRADARRKHLGARFEQPLADMPSVQPSEAARP